MTEELFTMRVKAFIFTKLTKLIQNDNFTTVPFAKYWQFVALVLTKTLKDSDYTLTRRIYPKETIDETLYITCRTAVD